MPISIQKVFSKSDTSTEISNVTVVVVPRERFQFARESLESLFQNTTSPFNLIYIDNNSPVKLRNYLLEQAQLKGFRLVQSKHFLSPNQARNLGLSYVHSKYVVFVDNDVVFAPGWLPALVKCAEETGATVVGSLVCQYRPVHQTIHCAGGTYMSDEDFSRFIAEPVISAGQPGKFQINEKSYYLNSKIDEVRHQLKRQQTGLVEFHSVLIKTQFFKNTGPLDEGFSCSKDYLDLCMTVARTGNTVYLEPASVVTFLSHPPAPALKWSDLPYFMMRWSDAWERASLLHFQRKWNLEQNEYFKKRFKRLGWRRREEMIVPLMSRFNFLGTNGRKWVEKRLVWLDKKLNRYLSGRYERSMKRLGNEAMISKTYSSEQASLSV